LKTIESAIEFLAHARKKFEDEGYEIQTVRIATQPLSQYLNVKSVVDATADRHDPEFAAWATQLVQQTKNISFSVTVASERGVHTQTALTAAETIVALSKASPGGEGNF